MRMNFGVWTLILLLISMGASAQDYRYDVYLDSDANSGTGCNVVTPSGTVSGVEARVRADLTNVTVSSSTLALCQAGSFPAGSPLPAPYAAGLNNGTAGSDVIEMATPATLAPAGSNVPAYVVGWNGANTASDLLATTTGQIGAPPILIGFPVVNIPTLGLLGLGLMVLVLAVFGFRRIRAATRASLAAIGLMMMAGAVWAAAFVADGQVGDWAGVAPLATDPAADGSTADTGIDVRAFYAAFENGNMFLRIDVTDIENQPPVANPVALTLLEDAAPSTITLSANDLDGDPLTFAVQTAPTRGTVGAVTPINVTSASVVYTLTPNANGADSFTYVANDGFVNSTPATVSITITPVNDAPIFTPQNPPAVNEDAGAQTATIASGLSAGPADESGQTIAFTITGNTNAALFAGVPTISPAGVLSYTPAANANGTAQITFTAQDNGGVANGGVDTAAPQTITVTVNSVNDVPMFTAGANQTVLEDAAAVTVNGWATGISPGPADEAAQVLTFAITANTNAALFIVAPAVDATTGNLTFTPRANANGSATISLRLSDNGGTANGGVDTSAAQTFTVTVTAVNDEPSFENSGNVTVLKDTGANTIPNWAFGIIAGPPDEASQTLSFTVTSNTNPTFFAVAPAISPTGTLTFTTAPNANGTATIVIELVDNGGTANGGDDTSISTFFAINLTAVNDAPTFTAGANQTVLEDAGAQTVAAWATAISAGPPDEAGQVLTFNVTGNTNPGLFSAAPAVNATTGNLTYTPAANVNGSASITLTLSDNGGTANGGVDTSAPVTFTINVTAVNDVPVFTAGANQTVSEDAGAQTVTSWATGISAGPADEFAQILVFTVTNNTNPTLFAVQPQVSPTGELTYTPAANVSGAATISVNLQDTGGTANGGVDTAAAQNFTITVNSVNDAPAFVAGANQTVLEDAGAQIVPAWATGINPGPLDEAAQTLTFNITGNTNAALFTAGPAVSAVGQLTYTLAPNAFGVASITLNVQDNGGTANGGVDTSATQTFTITVTGINDVPSFTAGANQAVPQNAGAQTVNPWATAISAGPANESAQTLTFNITGNTNPALFSAAPAISPAGVLTYTPAVGAAGVATISTTLQDNGGTANGGVDTTAVQTFTISIDSAPTVTASTPTSGQTVPNNQALSITFNEVVDVGVNGVTLVCNAVPIALTGGSSGANVSGLIPSFAGSLPSGSCTLTVVAAQVTDDDTIDPPDQMVADFVVTFTVDAAPSVRSIAPANGSTNVSSTAPVLISFMEQVANAGAAFSVECPTGSPATFTTSASPATDFTLTPTTSWPAGVTCTVTVVAGQITDTDSIDPPDLMAANFVSTFATDAAPTVTGGTPLTGATGVSTTTPVTYTFSENVDAGPGPAITLECPVATPIAGTISGSGTGTLTFTPSAALPAGTACTATAVAANIRDSDLNDPPDLLAADSVRTFTTDAPPAVSGTNPANGATGVPGSNTITVSFSELVNFDTTANAANTSFDFECPAGSPANFTVLTASPAASVVIDPLDAAVAGQTCVLTVRATGITDADLGDPPNDMLADFTATIAFAGVANDDAYTITPHLTYLTPISVTGNDVLGAETITGFGPTALSANGAVPNGTNTITAGGVGGRIVMNADGTFTAFPDAGDDFAGGTVIFFYQLSGGDTAQVTLTFEAEDFIWFVDSTSVSPVCTGTNVGTQACPSSDLATVTAVDTANDVIFIDSGTYAGVANTLANTEMVIGNGATSTLSAVVAARVTPVAGSSFAPYDALNGTPPVLTCPNVTCLTLGTGNTLRGFSIGDSGAPGTDLAGANFGTLTVDEVSLSGTGRALNLTTGTISGGGFTSVASTSSATQGINLAGLAGTLNLGSTTISAATTQGILVGTTTGTVNFANTTVGSGTDCVSFQNNPTGTFTFGTLTLNGCGAVGFLHALNGGAVTATGATNITNVAGAGMSIDGNTTPLTFADVLVNKAATAGNGVLINNATGLVNTGVLSLTIGNGGGLIYNNSIGGLVTAAGSSISTAAGLAIGSANASGWNANFATLTVTGSPASGITLSNVAGSITALAGGITGTNGPAFQVIGAMGTVSLGGFMSKTSAGRLISITGGGAGSANLSGNLTCNTACTGIEVSFRNAGTYSFTGANKTLTTGGNPGVNLQSNAGATVNFSGGNLVINTTSGAGFTATGGATAINVTGTGNTITSTTGTALNVANSTIGASGLTFQSISANGAVNGIVLNTTGGLGGLTVSGLAAPGSGGTIQNTTGNGIRLIATSNPSFNRISINNTTGSGIKGTGSVNGFSLTNSSISNSNDAATDGANTVDESNVAFNDNQAGNETNLTGTVVITGNTLTNARYHGIDLFNNNGTISSATISNNVITSPTAVASTLGSGIRLIAFGSATTGASVTSALISNNTVSNFPSGGGILAQAGVANVSGPGSTVFGNAANPAQTISITGNLIAGETAVNRMNTQAILTSVNGKGTARFDVSNNGSVAFPLRHTSGTTMAGSTFGNTTSVAAFSNNVVQSNNTLASQGFGGGTSLTFLSADLPVSTVDVTNNTISQTDGNGILVVARDATGTLRSRITGNTVAAPLGGVRPGIRVDSGNPTSTDENVCVNLANNTSAGSGGTNGIGLRKQGTVTTTHDFGVHNMVATASPAVEGHVVGQNPAGNGVLLISATSGFSNCSNP